MFAIIQTLIDQETRLAIPAAHLTPRADLYALGLSAFDAIRLLVAVERAFGVELPRDMLKRETAASIESIGRALAVATPAPVMQERLAA
jgi:acyl carrier protein